MDRRHRARLARRIVRSAVSHAKAPPSRAASKFDGGRHGVPRRRGSNPLLHQETSMRYEIAGTVYPTQAAVRQRASQILNTRLGEVHDPAARAFVIGLLEHHPFASDVIGTGVKRVLVKTVQPFGTRGFWVDRTDGTGTDFSYLKCLRPTKPRDTFNAACRTAVRDQIQWARTIQFGANITIQCPVSGELITRDTSHVDHAVPWTFQAIVDAYLASNPVDLATVAYVGYSATNHLDGQIVRQFQDETLARSFAEFHAGRATLRVVSRHANLSILRRG